MDIIGMVAVSCGPKKAEDKKEKTETEKKEKE
jgi:hypothetical protein